MVGACLLAGLAACSAQQLYAGGQAWQRNQCFKLVDAVQRERCLARTRVPYDQYERERRQDAKEAGSGPP
jgi:hypothetical protein